MNLCLNARDAMAPRGCPARIRQRGHAHQPRLAEGSESDACPTWRCAWKTRASGWTKRTARPSVRALLQPPSARARAFWARARDREGGRSAFSRRSDSNREHRGQRPRAFLVFFAATSAPGRKRGHITAGHQAPSPRGPGGPDPARRRRRGGYAAASRVCCGRPGNQVVEAPDGVRAIEIYAARESPRPNLVILDLDMPVLTGEENAKRGCSVSTRRCAFSSYPVTTNPTRESAVHARGALGFFAQALPGTSAARRRRRLRWGRSWGHGEHEERTAPHLACRIHGHSDGFACFFFPSVATNATLNLQIAR